MIKHIDELGRIVIPMEIRDKLKISKNDDVRIDLVGDMIVIQKYDSNKELENLIKKSKLLELYENND